MNRVQKAIKDIYGDKVPDVKKNDTVKMAKTADSSPTKATSPVASPEKAAETPKEESVKETKKKDEKSDDDGDEVMSKGKLRTKFVEIKVAFSSLVKLTSPIAFYKSLQSGLAMDLINTPMSKVSYLNDKNPWKIWGIFTKNLW